MLRRLFVLLRQQGEAFFNGRIEQLAALALRDSVPAIYEWREFAVAGGLLSYGSAITDSYRLTGNYTGRVLKGFSRATNPPTCQSSR
jgi:hypothetical protein